MFGDAFIVSHIVYQVKQFVFIRENYAFFFIAKVLRLFAIHLFFSCENKLNRLKIPYNFTYYNNDNAGNLFM